MIKDNEPSRTVSCDQCGKCCEKGGPAFHLEDRHLIDSGAIATKHLYTVREGEPVYDNVKGQFIYSETDIIKVKWKEKPFSNILFACLFFDFKKKACDIYEKRPVECRTLTCKDVTKIKDIYSKERLTRKDLLENVKGLWDIVDDHQKRCSYNRLKIFIQVLDDGENTDALNGILDIVSYDENLRLALSEKSGVDFQMMDFLFGRPVSKVIEFMGFKVKKDKGKYIVSPVKSMMGEPKLWCQR